MFRRAIEWAQALRSKWAEISLEKKLGMFVAPIVVGVVLAVVVPRITDGGGNAGPSGERLEVSDLTVENSPDGTSVDISVRNTGDLVAVATSARFRIESFAILGACLPEAFLLPTHTYQLVLPTQDAQGKVRDVSLSQKIDANDADRFIFSVGVDDPQLTSTVSYLYRVKIDLFHDRRQKPVQAGEIWLAEPFPQEHWFSVPDHLYPEERPMVEECVDRNKSDLSAIYRKPASSSPELTAFAENVGARG